MSSSGDKPARRRRRRPNAFRRFAVVGLAVTVAAAGLLYRFTDLPPVIIYLIAMSGCAFALCGYDKSVAGRDATRVPENVLFGSALLGGTPGLLLGMNFFRHKTRKTSFQAVFGAIMVAQAAFAYWYFFYRT